MQSQKFFAISYHNTIFPCSDICRNIATVPAKTSQVVLSKADNCNSFNGVPDADYVICTTAYLSCSVYKIFVKSPLYYANSTRIRSELWALRSTQGISTGFAYKQGISREPSASFADLIKGVLNFFIRMICFPILTLESIC